MDIDYNAVFGLEVSENTQEAADPVEEAAAEEPIEAEEANDEGANEQEVADPVEVENDSDTEEAEEAEPETDNTQSKSERAQHAAARRKAEMEEAVRKARDEERANLEALIKRLGIPSPYEEGKSIESLDELNKYEKDMAAKRFKADLRAGKLSPDELAKYIVESEPMRNIAQVAADAQQKQKEADEAAFRAKVDEEIKEIQKLDPSIKGIEDFAKMENFEEFRDLVNRGNSYLNAYKLANFDKITEKISKDVATAAQQQAVNRIASKKHLTPTSTRGAGAVTVPADIMAFYKQFNPGATEAEIQRHYNKTLKERK